MVASHSITELLRLLIFRELFYCTPVDDDLGEQKNKKHPLLMEQSQGLLAITYSTKNTNF